MANVIQDPTLMECMTPVSTRLASKECRYMTYCIVGRLLAENGGKLAAAKSNERDGKILALVDCLFGP